MDLEPILSVFSSDNLYSLTPAKALENSKLIHDCFRSHLNPIKIGMYLKN